MGVRCCYTYSIVSRYSYSYSKSQVRFHLLMDYNVVDASSRWYRANEWVIQVSVACFKEGLVTVNNIFLCKCTMIIAMHKHPH